MKVLDVRLRIPQYGKNEERIPVAGVAGTYKKLEPPKYEEGFDTLYYVRMTPDFEFILEDFSNEI